MSRNLDAGKFVQSWPSEIIRRGVLSTYQPEVQGERVGEVGVAATELDAEA